MKIKVKIGTSSYAVYNNSDLGYNVDSELNGKYVCTVLGIPIHIPKEDCEIVQEEPIKPILKPFTFEEWNKDRSQPVWTTKYGKVEELTYFVNCKDSYPLVGLVNKSKVAYSLEGRSCWIADDLMLESKEKEYYANVYRNADGSVEVGHASDKAYSKEQAEKHRDIFIMTISFKC